MGGTIIPLPLKESQVKNMAVFFLDKVPSLGENKITPLQRWITKGVEI
jgi:hypothetical protein